jgi:hypothetical protein
VGEPFPLRSIPYIDCVPSLKDREPQWIDSEWEAEVAYVDEQFRLIVLELKGGLKFELPGADIICNGKLWPPERSELYCYGFPSYPCFYPYHGDDEPWMYYLHFGLSPKYCSGEISLKPVKNLII